MKLLLNVPREKIQNEIFNVGYENMSISEIAILVKQVVEREFPKKGNIKIFTTSSEDNRSYHINSDKIRYQLNYQPKYSIDDAIRELCHAFQKGKLPDSFENDFYFNVQRLKRLEVK